MDAGQYSIRAVSLSGDLCGQLCSCLIEDAHVSSALVLFRTLFCLHYSGSESPQQSNFG